jgi:hypothetical protein
MNVVDAPAVAILIVAVIASVALATTGQRFVHARFPAYDFVRHNEVGGFIVSVAGATYAVLLGFLTAVAWQHFTEARQLVSLESAAAADAWHTSVGLPMTSRMRVRDDVRQYANAMVESEWPAMLHGDVDPSADYLVMDAFDVVGTLKPKHDGEANAQQLTLEQLTTLHDLRQRRLSDNVSSVSWFEWTTLGVGAVGVIGFCWLFGLENARIHLLMTGIVTTIVVATLVLLFELQYPFRTDLRVSDADWRGVVAHIKMMQTGKQAAMRM